MKSKKKVTTPATSQLDNTDINRFSTVIALGTIYVGLMLVISNTVNEVQPVPYLDEIYHIPQAMEYCRGNFTHWDNRITTLPGLYLISVGIIKPLSYWLGKDVCDTPHLRYTNILLSLFNFLLYVWIVKKLHCNDKGSSQLKQLFSAINVALFPPLFFFAFLYYTDVAAAFLVFLMYNLHLDGRNLSAAAAGIIAVVMRQTSIVWTILVAVGCLDIALQHKLLTVKERNKSEILSTWRQIKLVLDRLLLLTPFSKKMYLIGQLFTELLAYILVGILFIAFVIINDGLVVGDRSAHQATINLPQLFYFFGLVTVFAAPHWLSHILPFIKACLKNWHIGVVTLSAIALIIRYNTIVHPYLLADNRHYTFYVWKKVYEYHPLGRYFAIPLYLFGAYVTYKTMVNKSFIFTCAFLACCCIALVPQRLLEIRYFFIPFLLLRLHVSPRSWMVLILELLMYTALNAATLYLFLARPFYWSDSPLIQRFMW